MKKGFVLNVSFISMLSVHQELQDTMGAGYAGFLPDIKVTHKGGFKSCFGVIGKMSSRLLSRSFTFHLLWKGF